MRSFCKAKMVPNPFLLEMQVEWKGLSSLTANKNPFSAFGGVGVCTERVAAQTAGLFASGLIWAPELGWQRFLGEEHRGCGGDKTPKLKQNKT